MLRRIVVVVSLVLAAAAPAAAEPGDVDPGFAGTVPDGFHLMDVALQSDGRAVVLAQQFDVAIDLYRLTADGAVDESFGDDGRVRIVEGRYAAGDVVTAADDRIAVTYSSYYEPRTQSYSTMVLLGADGEETARTGGFAGSLGPLAFRSDDVMAGAAFGTLGFAGFQPAVVRVGPSGAVTRVLDLDNAPRSVSVDGAGRTVIGLFAELDFAAEHTYVVRLRPDDRPDPSFGFGGIVSVPTGVQRRAADETVESTGGVAGVDAADRIIVSGSPPRRLLEDGRLDATFDARSVPLPNMEVHGVDGRGGILVSSTERNALVRLEPSGAWDTAFGRCGAVAGVSALAVRDGRAVGLRPGRVIDLRLDGTTPAEEVHDHGLVTAAETGAIRTFGGACFAGSVTFALNRPVVTVETTPSALGYWLAAGDGGIFTFGDAPFLGSTGAMRLNQPIVTMAATPSGRGYWLVAGDGGVFTFGDAPFLGSLGALRLNQPIVGMTPSASGRGYWLVAADGGVFTFGDAPYLGSGPERGLSTRVVDIARTPSGGGYWMLAVDGEILTFGDAEHHGGPTLAGRVPTALVSVPDGYVVAYDRDRFVDALTETGGFLSAFRQGWPSTVVDAAYAA